MQADVDVIEGRTECPSEHDTPFEERVENLKGESFWSCNLAVRRSVLPAISPGGLTRISWRRRWFEDMEFAWRFCEAIKSVSLALSPSAGHPSSARLDMEADLVADMADALDARLPDENPPVAATGRGVA